MRHHWSVRWSFRLFLVFVLVALPLYIVPVVVSQLDMETERVIFHRVWDRVNHQLMGVAWDGPSAADVIETERTVLNDVYDSATNSLRVGVGSAGTGSATTGIQTDATDILSMRHKVTELGPGVFNLARHHTIWATVGSTGASFNLPDASLTTTPSEYVIIIKDTGDGFVTLNAFAGQTVNGLNGASPLTGKGAAYYIKRMSVDFWDVMERSVQAP